MKMNGVPNFEEFLSDLLKSFIKDQQTVAFIKERLGVILSNLNTQATQGAERYVSNYVIPEISRLIQSSCGVSVEKQLMSLKPFIFKGLATFLREGRVPNKDEIIQMAKRCIPELVIETAIPNASENTKTLVRNALNQVQEAIFTQRPWTIPSVDKLLKTLFEKCCDEAFCIDKDKLSQVIDKLIETMPEYIDDITEFMTRHVLPALSVCFEAAAFALVAVFLRESSQRLRKEGRVRGRDLAKPLAMKAVDVASKQVAKNTVLRKTVERNVVTPKIAQKCVIDKAGGKMAAETTKKVAVKSTKKVVKVGTKAVKSVSGKAIKRVGGKAIKRIGSKATRQGARVAGRKTVQKASVKVTKNLGDRIGNGVTEVTKKSAVEKTTKAAAEVGMKNAAKAGLTAAGISAVVGGVFLYRDLKDLDKEKEKGSLSEKEYKEQKVQRVGEFAGDVIGSGVVGAAVSIVALTGPAGWAAIGAGALFSFATGKLGGHIAKKVLA